MSDVIRGEKKILHRAVLKTMTTDGWQIACSPPLPFNMCGKFVTLMLKGGEGEPRIIADSDGERVRFVAPITTPFDDLSREVVFWEPGEMPSPAMQRAQKIAESAIRPSTLAAEFSTAERRVTKDEVVDAIAKALLPFVERMEPAR